MRLSRYVRRLNLITEEWGNWEMEKKTIDLAAFIIKLKMLIAEQEAEDNGKHQKNSISIG